MLAESTGTIARGSVSPVHSEGPAPLSSPLLGLWLAFVSAVFGCTAGVVAGQIPAGQSAIAVLLLATVIRLTAGALRVPAQPVPMERVRQTGLLAVALLASALNAVRGPASFVVRQAVSGR